MKITYLQAILELQRDNFVIGPENGNQEILMLLNERDGSNGNFDQRFSERKALADYLQSLSTYTRFKRFALDFRLHENDQIQYSEVEIQGKRFIKLKLTDACEYMLTKDYTDNWESEMHERFCFWSFEDWKTQMVKAGFEVLPGSRPYTNPWIQKNRFRKKVKLYKLHKGELTRLPEPPTNALIIGKRLVESKNFRLNLGSSNGSLKPTSCAFSS